MLSNTIVSTTYQGDGSTTTFAIQCDIISNDQVVVTSYDSSTGVTETLVEGTDYNITGGDPGTNVEFVVAPSATQDITVKRSTAKTQSVDYQDTAAFPIDDHETQMDKMVMMIQEIANDVADIEVTVPTGSGALVRLDDQAIAAAGTVTVSSNQRMLKFIEGDGSATTADTTTPIENGSTDGQELKLVGLSDTNTVTITNSGNVSLNGDITFNANTVLDLFWSDDQTKWIETTRRG